MPVDGTQILDSRIQVVFACAIDYSSWHDEGEEQVSISSVTKQFPISVKEVEEIRAWWFQEKNKFLNDLKKAAIQFLKAEDGDADEVETLKAQFESDVFCSDLIGFLGMHLFGEPPSDDDIQFAETIEVNDVDPEDLNPYLADFLQSSIPVEVTAKFFNSPAGLQILETGVSLGAPVEKNKALKSKKTNSATTFEKQVEILSELWLNHRKEEEFIDFVEYNDIGLPLAFIIQVQIVEPTEKAKSLIGETFNLLLAGFHIAEDEGFETLEEILDSA
jgi:hypothetical protein